MSRTARPPHLDSLRFIGQLALQLQDLIGRRLADLLQAELQLLDILQQTQDLAVLGHHGGGQLGGRRLALLILLRLGRVRARER